MAVRNCGEDVMSGEPAVLLNPAQLRIPCKSKCEARLPGSSNEKHLHWKTYTKYTQYDTRTVLPCHESEA